MDRQEAAFIVVGVEQRELLMSVHDVDRVVDVPRDGAGRTRIAGAVEIDQGVGQTDYLAQAPAYIFQARDGRLRAEVATAVGQTAAGELETGIGA